VAKLNIKPRLEMRARLLVLHDVVQELFAAFGAIDRSGVLKRGIIDSQVIRHIRLRYLNAESELVGRVTISIDWEKHHVFAATPDGQTLEVKQAPGASVAEQVHKTLTVLVKHTELLRAKYNVTRVVPSYEYVPEVEADEEKRNRTREQLSLRARTFVWSEGNTEAEAEIEEELMTFMEFSPSKLKELKIKVEQRPPDAQ
jgi:hypothetical protein